MKNRIADYAALPPIHGYIQKYLTCSNEKGVYIVISNLSLAKFLSSEFGQKYQSLKKKDRIDPNKQKKQQEQAPNDQQQQQNGYTQQVNNPYGQSTATT